MIMITIATTKAAGGGKPAMVTEAARSANVALTFWVRGALPDGVHNLRRSQSECRGRRDGSEGGQTAHGGRGETESHAARKGSDRVRQTPSRLQHPDSLRLTRSRRRFDLIA